MICEWIAYGSRAGCGALITIELILIGAYARFRSRVETIESNKNWEKGDVRWQHGLFRAPTGFSLRSGQG
jgi:hypothetical protein